MITRKPEPEKDNRDEFSYGKFSYKGHGLEKFGWALPVALIMLSLAAAICAILFGVSKLVSEMKSGRVDRQDSAESTVVDSVLPHGNADDVGGDMRLGSVLE